MRWLAIAVALVGCDRVFGLSQGSTDAGDASSCGTMDLDGDGILDGCDPCIAPATDATADVDKDGIPNGMDACPLDSAQSAMDSDGDGIPDNCDPSPSTFDKPRCLMAFTSPTVSGKLWLPVGNSGWQPLANRLHADAALVPVVSATAESLEAPQGTTSYTSLFELEPGGGLDAHLAMYPRFADTATLRGCQLDLAMDGDITLSYASDRATSNAMTSNIAPVTTAALVLMTAKITPTGTQDTITCTVFVVNTATGAGNELATSGIDDDLPGTFGLSIDHFSADDFALWILTE